MGIQIASSPVELATDLYLLQIANLPLESVSVVCELLSNCCRGSRLAMSPAHHRNFGVQLGSRLQSLIEASEGWYYDLLQTVVHHKSVGKVVDIFGGAGEM